MLRFLRSKKAFTLVELMIVVAIIGILAGIAIPRYMNFIRRSREGATKGNLGALRSALNIYYSDNEGIFPPATAAGFNAAPFIGTSANNYLDAIPQATEDCDQYATHKNNGMGVAYGQFTTAATNVGGWQYNAGFAATNFSTAPAKLFTNCSRTDSKSTIISSW
jgi:prepilin-type N-terminal cleavage/methylation domain-containing protein